MQSCEHDAENHGHDEDEDADEREEVLCSVADVAESPLWAVVIYRGGYIAF